MLYQLRQAFRRLLREPGFTAAVVLTLALGVGANVAVFTVVEALLLRPLPYPDADRLVTLRHRDQATGNTKEFIAIGDYVDLADRQSVFAEIGAYGTGPVTIFGEGEPQPALALSATPELLTMLGFRPVIGRGFSPEEGRTGSALVAILGHDLWRDRFGSDPSIVGRSIRIGEQARTVIGVAPAGFRFPPQTATGVIVNQPMPAQAPPVRKSGWTFALARLAPGRSPEEVDSALARISRQLETEYPDQNKGSTYYAQSLRDATLGSARTPLVFLLAAVGLVLLIACANVANLLLARSLGRRRELAVRMAIGAGRRRLVGQLLTETFALALVAGLVGLAFGAIATRALVGLVPASVAPPDLVAIGVNGAVLAFTLGVVLLTAFGCGLIGAMSMPIEDAAPHYLGSGKASVPASARRATSTLVAAEVALAVVLLLGAGLVLKSFAALVSVDPGFQLERIAALRVALPAERYGEADARGAFLQQAFDAIRAVPGVEEAGAAIVVPLTGNNWTVGFERVDQPVPEGERPPEVGWQLASGGYFRTLRIPLVAGRLFDARDRPDSPPVVIVSEAIQQRFFPGESAIGHLLDVGQRPAEIVGVVGDIRRAGLRDEPWADLYFPLEQSPDTQMTVLVRTSADPAQIVAPVIAALRNIEPNVVVRNPTSLEQIAADSIQDTRLLLWLLGLFALLSLALASVGIYGVMAYAVRQRTREIGTRVALGAQRSAIVWMVMRQGGAITLTGLALGIAIASLSIGTLRSLLYGVSAFDAGVALAATGVLIAAAAIACYIPARRAAGVDPASTLQEE